MNKFDELYNCIVEKVEKIDVKKQIPINSRVTWTEFGGSAKEGIVMGYKNHPDQKDGYILVKDGDGKEHKLIWSALTVRKK